jgi:hypothetical protein
VAAVLSVVAAGAAVLSVVAAGAADDGSGVLMASIVECSGR